MSNKIVEISREYVKERFESIQHHSLTYHNWQHTEMVYNAVDLISSNTEGISSEDKEHLLIAALFHDIGFLKQAEGHEEIGACIAAEFLKKQDYPKVRIREVKRLIRSTLITYEPQDRLENIIRDADLAHLGNEDYMDTTFKDLSSEIKTNCNLNYTEEEWADKCVHFLSAHKYLTDFARKHFRPGKKKNLQKLKSILVKK